MALFPMERKCAECGKEFLGFDEWVFRRGEEWFCSWGCTRTHDKKAKRSRYGQVRRLDKIEKTEIREMLTKGVSPQKIADRVGVTVQAVLYYKQKAEA